MLLTENPEGGWGLRGHANTNAELVGLARAQIAELRLSAVNPHLRDRLGGNLDPLVAESVGHQRLALGAYPYGHFAHEIGPGLGRFAAGI